MARALGHPPQARKELVIGNVQATIFILQVAIIIFSWEKQRPQDGEAVCLVP